MVDSKSVNLSILNMDQNHHALVNGMQLWFVSQLWNQGSWPQLRNESGLVYF